MLLGEAIAERDFLNRRLGALESRLAHDTTHGVPLTHVIQEIELTANRLLALQDAIDWTLQHLAVSQKPLGTYVNKSNHLQLIADILENAASPERREKIDELREAKKTTDVLIQKIYWAYDLQIPEVTISDEAEEEE